MLSKNFGIKLIVVLLILGCFLFFLDWDTVQTMLLQFLHNPQWLLLMALTYTGSFALRALAWKDYVQGRGRFAIYLNALFYSLLVNHLLPVKVGDVVRVGVVVKEQVLNWEEAVQSVVVMRSLDMLILALVAGLGLLWVPLPVSWAVTFSFVLAGLVGAAFLLWLVRRGKLHFLQKHLIRVRDTFRSEKGGRIVLLTLVSWVMEAFVVFGVAQAVGLDLGFLTAVWVNSMTIAGQVFHVAPGGLGTYESVMSTTLTATGVLWQEAFAVALLSHAFKFAYSFVAGAWAILTTPVRSMEIQHWIATRRNNHE